MVKIFMGLFLILVHSACVTVEDKDKDKDKKQNSTAVAGPDEKRNEQTQVQPQPPSPKSQQKPPEVINPFAITQDQYFSWTAEPNSYRVQMKKPEGAARVFRTHLQDGSKSSFEVPEAMLVDSHVIVGHTYRYRFLGAEGQLIHEEQLQIPKDFVVSGRRLLGADYASREYRRLYFLEDSVLVLQNFRLQLQVRQILAARGARVITFDSGTQAGPGQAGRAGGQLQLQANHARGGLRLEMRGEHGGHGRKPEPPYRNRRVSNGPCPRAVEGIDGEPGGHGGSSGKFRILILNKTAFSVEASVETSRGGHGAAGSDYVECIRGGKVMGITLPGYSAIAAGAPGAHGSEGAKEISSFIMGQQELVFQ